MRRFAFAVAVLTLATAPVAAQSFGFGWLEREGVETKEGPQAPPWKRTKVQGGFFGVPAQKTLTGDVTILPFDPSLPAASLPLKSLGRYEKEECSGQFSKYRNVEFDDLPGDAYLQYVQPDKLRGQAFAGRVLFLHAAKPGAKTLPKQSVAAGDMPKGFPLATLEAAFDISGLGKADVIRVDYCCYGAALDNAQCIKAGGKDGGNRCFALYHRNKAGWRRVFRDRDDAC